MSTPNDGSGHDLRQLTVDDLYLLASIDRTEPVTRAYRVECDRLTEYPVDWNIPNWDTVGDGGHSVQRLIDWLIPVLEDGGLYFGAFDGDSLTGVVIVQPGFDADLAWLTFLHVSRPYRGRGVGTALWDHATALALQAGATAMYVSATPTGPTIDFYLARGCKLANPPHPRLLAKEPDDIHLTCLIAPTR